jgi:hypothetical protein
LPGPRSLLTPRSNNRDDHVAVSTTRKSLQVPER